MNLRSISIQEVALAAAAFACGVAAAALVLAFVSDTDPLLGPLGAAFVVALPLSISPFIYVVGFLIQESSLAGRRTRAQVISAAVSGAGYVLVLFLVNLMAEHFGAAFDPPDWVGMLLVLPTWLFGPVLVALVSLWVEVRIERREQHANRAS